MEYKNLTYESDEIKRTIKILEYELKQLQAELDSITYDSEKTILGIKKYYELLAIKKYLFRELVKLKGQYRESESKIYKSLYIDKYGVESNKDWRGIVL